MYLISPNQKQYKANLHCHSTLSDGKRTPQELKEMYKRNGYSILAITDHEVPKSHNDLSDSEFLMLTGYECYIREDEHGAYDVYQREIHLNLFAKDPENETMICYNPCYCNYLNKEQQEALVKAGSERQREYNPAYINEYVQIAKDNGYLVAFNHPYWSLEMEADILQYEGLFSLEICNYGSFLENRLEYNGALYDKLLRSGKRMFCHSADDNHNWHPEGHPMCDSFGGFTMIMPEEFTYAGVIAAIEQGQMYSSMGPLFHEVSIDGDRLHVECSEVAQICVYFGSKSPVTVIAEEGKSLTEADFTIDARAPYVRVTIWDKYGRAADTRGVFRDEF